MKRSIVRSLLLAGAFAGLLVGTSPAHAVGFIVGAGNIEKTTDAGGTWSFSGSAGGELDGLQFLDANIGIAVGTLGRVVRTSNGGSSWSTITTPTTNQLEDVSFPTSTIGYATGAGVLLKSTDAGLTWSSLTSPTGACWGLGIAFTSSTTGVIVSDCGGIYRTTDSGASWTSELSGTASRLEDITFPTATTGYVVGFSHTILKTTDGGVTWAAQTSPVTNTDLKGVTFTSASTGWVVGTNGVILFTTNGGATWTQRGNPAGNRELRCVAFANDQEGVIGGAGVDLRTLDGGLSWVEVFPPSDNYNDIAMLPSAPITGTVSVTVTTNPVSRHFKVDGADWSAATTFRWLAGEIHQIEADATQTVSGTEQFVFGSWSDGGARQHNVSSTTTKTFTATYTHQFKLTMGITSGSGAVSPATAFKNAGSTVSISATPGSGYTFGGWAGSGTGSVSGSTNPANVTMNGAITENATFTPGPVSVTIHGNPSGRTVVVDGTTQTTPVTVTWTVGTSHTLNTASPQSGGTGTQYVWTSWSDGGARSHSVTASPGGTSFTANFKTQYLLTMTPPPSPYFTVPTTGYQDAGTSVAIDCIKNPLDFSSQYFFSWAGTGSGSYSGVLEKVNVTMNGPITQTAGFGPLPSALHWIGTSPNGLAFTVNGTTYTDTTLVRLLIGTTIPVATDSLQNADGTSRKRFHDWSDGGNASHSYGTGIGGADTLIATFRTQYMLTVVPDTGGTVSPASDYRDRGAQVFIQATPLPFFGWGGWIGAGSGSYTGGNVSSFVTMNGPLTEIPRFIGVPIPQLIKTANPAMQYQADGVTFTGNHTFVWTAGSPHTIAAVTPVSIDAGTRLVFAGWSDLGALSHVIAPLAPDSVTESCKFNYLLTMIAGTGGTVSPATGWFTPGSVNIKATPDPGKLFTGWTGTGTSPVNGTANPVNVNLLGPTTETAGFADTSQVGVDDGPAGFALEQNAPNPVRARATTIAFSLPHAGDVTLEVLDLAGRRVATLAHGAFAAGRYARPWDATGDGHQPLGAGMYFYRLTWNGETRTRRVVVAR